MSRQEVTALKYRRMPIEEESPEQFGYDRIGPGHWFEQDRRHMRIGYAWPLPEELEGGLTAISASIRAALTK